MLSTGGLFSAKLWKTTNSDALIRSLGLHKEYVVKPLTAILGNASIHKTKENGHIINFLKNQGVQLVHPAALKPRTQ